MQNAHRQKADLSKPQYFAPLLPLKQKRANRQTGKADVQKAAECKKPIYSSGWMKALPGPRAGTRSSERTSI
jgi:hypothetical protein